MVILALKQPNGWTHAETIKSAKTDTLHNPILLMVERGTRRAPDDFKFLAVVKNSMCSTQRTPCEAVT